MNPKSAAHKSFTLRRDAVKHGPAVMSMRGKKMTVGAHAPVAKATLRPEMKLRTIKPPSEEAAGTN